MSTDLPPALVEFMHQHGYRPQPLKPSGNGFLRFPVGKEANGGTSGYVKLSADGESAIFGNFKSGEQWVWHAKDLKGLSAREREARRSRVEKARQEADDERKKLQAKVADKAAELYNAAKAAKPDHPYLLRKRIRPCDAIRQYGNQLLIPVYIGDKLTSLQFIEEDGSKLFLSGGEIKGGCCLTGTPTNAICIAEGYATGCSIHEATAHAVAVAFNAGNLMPVAQAMRGQYPEATLILCADNDQWTEGNPGLTKATEAAIAVGALLAVPDFSECDISSRPTDFNDLHMLAGKEAVKYAMGCARNVSGGEMPDLERHPARRSSHPSMYSLSGELPEPPIDIVNIDGSHASLPSQLETRSVAAETFETEEIVQMKEVLKLGSKEPPEVTIRIDAPPEDESDAPSGPPRMPDIGYPPLIRDIVEVACAASEAHPVAVGANVLGYFSATVGRALFQSIGDAVIHCRPFPLIVGKSGKARKGTAEATVRRVFRRAEAIISKQRGVEECLRCHTGGLSTGEGIAWAIRDAVEPDERGRGGDPGVADKRMLAIESEFDNILSQLKRDNNTLSATIRNVFDGRDLQPLTKTNLTRATQPHVCILGHITEHELREKATANDLANGLLNRFLMLYVLRPKHVALPQPTPEAKIEELAQRVADAVMAVTEGNLHAENRYEITFSDTARDLWVEQYDTITRDREGKAGSLLARSEMYARMLAMIFAAMDGRLIIEAVDLHAAIAWVEYWNASVTQVFKLKDEAKGLAPFTAEVLDTVAQNPGITLTSMRKHWPNSRRKQVDEALKVLLNLAPPLIEQRKERTNGRSVTRYYLYEKK
jgi:putative DNA primase/helicase